jgi:hypothetical protein
MNDRGRRRDIEEKLNLINQTNRNKFLLREFQNKSKVKEVLTRYISDLARHNFLNFDPNNLSHYL